MNQLQRSFLLLLSLSTLSIVAGWTKDKTIAKQSLEKSLLQDGHFYFYQIDKNGDIINQHNQVKPTYDVIRYTGLIGKKDGSIVYPTIQTSPDLRGPAYLRWLESLRFRQKS